MSRRIPKAATCCVLALFTVAALALASPTERVRGAVDAIIGILKDSRLESDRSERRMQIRSVIDRHFDFEAMSQSVLATNWKRASDAERRQFVDFFSDYLEHTYLTAIEAYTDEAIEYRAEKVDGDRAVVDTVIVTATKEIPVTYKLRQSLDEWFAYDVVIEGVSLVNNYRSIFASIIKNEGMEGLLGELKTKIEAYRSGSGDMPRATVESPVPQEF
jgi:phospholipid transport system substrate-binding protein